MDYIIEYGVQVAAALLITLIGVLGTWLTVKIGKTKQLENILIAQGELTNAAQTTVEELQQTVVDSLKAAHKDGKLTQEEIAELGDMLIDKTVQKLSNTAYGLLEAASVDIVAMIKGVGESWIKQLKAE
ncbi:MAG: hypothetical protein RRZ24_10990 [Clostridia bacterium]